MKTIVLTGGGTGGHVTPNLALLPNLKKHFDKIYYLGNRDGIERKMTEKESSIIFCSIDTVKYERKFTLKNLLIPFKLSRAVSKVKKILIKISPNVVFSKGGFVSLPVCIAAKKLNIPIVSHESDITMGLANKLIYPISTKMLLSFKPKKMKKKYVVTGSPVRDQILKGKASLLPSTFSPAPTKKTLLFFGGSQGSKKINNAVFSSIDELVKMYNVLHIVGKDNATKKIKIPNYLQVEYAFDIENYLAKSDLIVCRSGANTLFEILALRKPNLLIPLSKENSRGDQILNAKYFENKGFSNVLREEDLTKEKLLESINKSFSNAKKQVEKMKKANYHLPNDIIVNEILSVSK